MNASDINNSETRGPVTEREINAFVDDQLDAESRQYVRAAMRKDPELAKAVCDADQLKDWVQQAYAAPPHSKTARLTEPRSSWGKSALAATVLLGVGLVAGWAGGAMLQPGQLAGTSEKMAGVGVQKQAARVILHVGSSDTDKMDEALDTAESLLSNGGSQNDFKLQILANSDGVDLLRTQTSPYAQRINNMISNHPNVEFTVCGQSLSRLRRRGEDVGVLPNVQVVDTAMGEVVERLQRGWSYVRI
ncbi:DsrE family protein [Guyparkeria sp. 1SP6A2]|nr:DsrE family protein [Guyparkeria sp. 1SP6A2]